MQPDPRSDLYIFIWLLDETCFLLFLKEKAILGLLISYNMTKEFLNYLPLQWLKVVFDTKFFDFGGIGIFRASKNFQHSPSIPYLRTIKVLFFCPPPSITYNVEAGLNTKILTWRFFVFSLATGLLQVVWSLPAVTTFSRQIFKQWLFLLTVNVVKQA